MTVEVIDQTCQTRAMQAALFVASEGEVMREDDSVNLGSINLSDLAKEKGFDWQKVCRYNDPGEGEEAARWFKSIDEKWDELYAEYLSEEERRFVRKVHQFQSLVDFGRFRVYGEIKPGGEECIVVVTEFIGFCDDDAVWLNINAVKDKTQAHLWVMREEPHLHKYYPANGDEGERETDELLNMTDRPADAKWFAGKNHGRMERQVELSWRIEMMTTMGFKRFLRRIKRETDAIWPEAGVGIM